MPDAGDTHVGQLEHGYTNATQRSGRWVDKRYLGPAATDRRETERLVLTRLQGHFPVPEVRAGSTDDSLRIAFVPGVHGQDMLVNGDPGKVLSLCGRTLAQLHSLDPVQLGYSPSDPAHRMVHGDYGPQNILLDESGTAVVAVLDWEFFRLGDPVDDVGMAEWVIRTHHPEFTGRLDSFYEGYGAKPDWPVRKNAMLMACRRFREFCVSWEDPAAVALWDQRIEATERFTE